MELLPSESLSTIKGLLQSLANQLNESNTHIASLETFSKELIPNKDALAGIPSAEIEAENNDERDHDEKYQIQRLEEERMGLIMDIQKQDFVTTKLNDIVQQNFDMVQSVKEYLNHSNQVHRDEIKTNNLILENYTRNVLFPNEDKLKINVVDLQIAIKRIQHLLLGISSSLEHNKLGDYRENLNELVRGLNLLLDKEF